MRIFPAKVNYVVKTIQLTHHDKNLVEDLNEIPFCGYNDWVVNKAKEITGRQCLDDLPPVPKIDDTVYDLMQEKASQEGKRRLYFGIAVGKSDQQRDGRTEAERPQVLIDDEYLEFLKP